MINRIEKKMADLKKSGEKAFIAYITAGLPDMERCADLIAALGDAGLDVLELGIPFSDPIADGPIIQDASFRSIQKGTNLEKCFGLVRAVRERKSKLPILFMMYYNTILHCGVDAFIESCAAAGVDGLIIPDLPIEEQGEIRKALDGRDETILIQLIAPVSGERIPTILDGARGFVYCVSSMGVTGQGGSFYREVRDYLSDVKRQSKIPVMMGFGIRGAHDVEPVRDVIDGAIVGSHFINLMESCGYNLDTAREYVRKFKSEF